MSDGWEDKGERHKDQRVKRQGKETSIPWPEWRVAPSATKPIHKELSQDNQFSQIFSASQCLLVSVVGVVFETRLECIIV